MNPQLALLFAQHKTAILGAGAAGVAGLALWQTKKKSTAATTGTAAATPIAGTIPAAAVVAPSVGGTYDSSSFDTYNALQPELDQILAQQTAAAATPAASSPLFTSNDQWLSAAESAWIQQDPKRNVTDLQNALVPWLNGQPVPSVANGGINWAVGNFGAPPQGTAKAS